MRSCMFLLFCYLPLLLAGTVEIPDDALRNTLIERYDLNDNGVIDQDEALAVRFLVVAGLSIQDLSGLEAFTNLQILDVQNNQLQGFPDLSGLTQLRLLNASNNEIANDSGLPLGLSQLNLANNRIPNLTVNLENMEQLNLANNLLSGILDLSVFTSLKHLTLSGNRLSQLNVPTSLEHLDVNNNQLSSLPTLPISLVTLLASGNSLSGLPTLPTTLQQLNVAHNNLETLQDLSTLSDLRLLNVAYNQLSTLQGVESLTQLRGLFAASNQLVDMTLPNNANLQILDLAENRFSALPDNMFTADQLTSIDISRNQVTQLPTGFFNSLDRLGVFLADHNQLQGLPNISNLLNVLWLRYNRLQQFPDLVNHLTYLRIGNNLLGTGACSVIGTILSELPYLEFLPDDFDQGNLPAAEWTDRGNLLAMVAGINEGRFQTLYRLNCK